MMTQLVQLGLWLAAAGAAVGGTRFQDQVRLELQDLAFLSGCWVGEFRGRGGEIGTIEEYYTLPSSNVMLGTTRYVMGERTVSYEFSLLSTDSAGVFLRPYPNGEPSADDFRLTELAAERAVFESPEHDYPKRILYWTEEDGTRVARIDAGPDDPGGMEWKLERRDCAPAVNR